MTRDAIHLIAPAGNCRSFLETLGVSNGEAFIELVARSLGGGYGVSGDPRLMFGEEDELRGGRTDDAPRAADLQAALANDHVRAVVAIRGGAWFTRVLPRIDFSVLQQRTKPVFVFGFSELTSLVNIVSEHERARGVLDMGPAFLTYGLRRHALRHSEVLSGGASPKEWMHTRLIPEFEAYWHRVVAIVEGRDPATPLRARLVRGGRPREGTARFVGGNLTVLSTLIGSRYESCIAPQGRWLVLEDFNDKPERFDRFLSHLTLARYWERCEGVLLGDFHHDDRDLNDAVLAMLGYHLPSNCEVPVLVTSTVGHIWPMTPLPLNRPLRISASGVDEYEFECRMQNDEWQK